MTTSDKIALASAVVSLVALVATIVFALLGRKYTKEQIKQATTQIEETRRQFVSLNTPDVEIHVYYRINPPEKRGVWLEATNHHPTITVNDLTVYAVGDSPSEKEAFSFLFLTFEDLKPMQKMSDRSLQELDSVMKKYFPNYEQSSAMIVDKPIGTGFDTFPIKVHFSFLPRLHGAQKVQGVRDLLLQVRREKGT